MKNIFVGNLNSDTTPQAIRSLFEPLGTVRKCKLMTDRDTGLSRGFAFVEMTEVEAGQAIAALDGRIVDGQTIQVREGRPKLHPGASWRSDIWPQTTLNPHQRWRLEKPSGPLVSRPGAA